MSVYAYTAVWDHSEAKGNARLVMLAIADSANKETGEAVIAVGFIARMTRLGESTVRAHVRDLEEAGELVLVDRGGGRGNHPQWRVNLGRYRQTNPPESGGFPNPQAGDNPGDQEHKPAENPPETRRKAAGPSAGFADDAIYQTPNPLPAGTPETEINREIAETLAEEWCRRRHVPALYSVVKTFTGQILEFLEHSPPPPDAWLEHAAAAGIREPAGWAHFAIANPIPVPPDPRIEAENRRRVEDARARAIAEADARAAANPVTLDHLREMKNRLIAEAGQRPDPEEVRRFVEDLTGRLDE